MSSIVDQIIHKRFMENKSYRKIGEEVDRSRTYVMNIINDHYLDYPELKPEPIEKPPKKVIKGHRKTSNHKTGEAADLLVDGYAARITKRYTNCGNPDCNKCKKDDAGKYEGHGPYAYLTYRDKEGAVISKYLTASKENEIITKKLISDWDINITFRSNTDEQPH